MAWKVVAWIVLAAAAVLLIAQFLMINASIKEAQRLVEPRSAAPTQCTIPGHVLKAYPVEVDVATSATMAVALNQGSLPVVASWLAASNQDVVHVSRGADGRAENVPVRFIAASVLCFWGKASTRLWDDVRTRRCRYVLCLGAVYAVAVPDVAWQHRIDVELSQSTDAALRTRSGKGTLLAAWRMHPLNMTGIPNGARLQDYRSTAIVGADRDSVDNRTLLDVVADRDELALIGYGPEP